MACMFSFIFKRCEENKTLEFKSPNNEIYNLTYVSKDDYLKLTLKWQSIASVLILVEIFNADQKPINYNLKKVFMAKVLDGNQVNITTCNLAYQGLKRMSSCECLVKVIPRAKQREDFPSPKAVPDADKKEMMPVTENKLQKLSDDMQNLLRTGNLSDVTLYNGSIEIPAHKVFLSARSSVFAKMFQHPTGKKKGQNRVNVSEMTDAVLKELLSFIYTGTVTIENMEMALDLYIVADQYDIKDLQSVCSSCLQDATLDSILGTLVLANFYHDQTLKLSSMDFILKNYSAVKSHKNWENFVKEHKDLSIEILTFIIDKKF